MSEADPEIEVSSFPKTGSVSVSVYDKDVALELAKIFAEASKLKEMPDGTKNWDIGWLETFEELDKAIKEVWPDCTCDLLCPVHVK
jgi:hypothetical protein